MAAVGLIRVDFRLIHGQVITLWSKTYPTDKIVIIDNDLAKDEFMSMVYESAAPSGVRVRIYDEDKAIRLWTKNQFGDFKVMILFRDISTCYHMYQKGLPMESVQIGGVPKKPNRANIVPAVNLSAEELQQLGEMDAHGIRVYAQVLPDQASMDLKDMEKRFKRAD